MPLLLVGLVGGGLGFFTGAAASDLFGKLIKLALLVGGSYFAYQMYKGS